MPVERARAFNTYTVAKTEYDFLEASGAETPDDTMPYLPHQGNYSQDIHLVLLGMPTLLTLGPGPLHLELLRQEAKLDISTTRWKKMSRSRSSGWHFIISYLQSVGLPTRQPSCVYPRHSCT